MGGNWGGIRRRGAGLGAESAAVTGGYSSAEEVETNSGGGWRRSQSGAIPSLQNSLQTGKITANFCCFLAINARSGENPHDCSMRYSEFPY